MDDLAVVDHYLRQHGFERTGIGRYARSQLDFIVRPDRDGSASAWLAPHASPAQELGLGTLLDFYGRPFNAAPPGTRVSALALAISAVTNWDVLAASWPTDAAPERFVSAVRSTLYQRLGWRDR
jgi:hypothetical protein